jgi:type IV pilus assembly protein PilQ
MTELCRKWINFAIMSVLLATALAGAACAAGPAETLPEAEKAPMLEAVTVRQSGAAKIFAEISGRNLPVPEQVKAGPNYIDFRFPGTTALSPNQTIGVVYPLMKAVEIRTVSGDVFVSFLTNKPLKLKASEGTAPASRYTLTFEAETTAQLPTAALPKPPLKPAQPDPLAKDTKVTLELRDVNIKDIFRMLGNMMNLNLVVDSSVPDTNVTLSLKDVPLKEAFSYLMRMHDLAYVMMGRTMIVGKPDTLAKTTGMEKTQAYHIAYADPKQIPGILQNLAGVSKIVVDERLRTLYVTGTALQQDEVRKILERVDHPGRQVMINARIIELKDTASREFEAMLDAIYNNWWLSYSGGNFSGGYADANYPNQIPSSVVSPTPFASDLSGLARSTLKAIDAQIATWTQGDVKGDVLASPSVITTEGKKATIKITENVKYVSARDDAGNPTYSDEEVGPILEFTPIIGRNEVINLEIKVSTGTITQYLAGGQGERIPQTAKREVQTSVRVRNGEPFVVGGLFGTDKSSTINRVPLLSDIPLIGELFKSKTKKNEKTQVVVVLVPELLDVPESAIEVGTLK